MSFRTEVIELDSLVADPAGPADGMIFQFPIPKGVDTSHTAHLTFTIAPTTGGAGTVVLIASFLAVEVANVLEADPTGGTTPVPRTLANTETLTSKNAQSDTENFTSGVTDKLTELEFGPFDVSDYYEGDFILVRLELDDDGEGNANILVFSAEIDMVHWTNGENI